VLHLSVTGSIALWYVRVFSGRSRLFSSTFPLFPGDVQLRLDFPPPRRVDLSLPAFMKILRCPPRFVSHVGVVLPLPQSFVGSLRDR